MSTRKPIPSTQEERLQNTIEPYVNPDTGEAVLGNAGSNGQRDFTAVGDAVNVTFRLEELTSEKDGRDLIIGEDTAGYLPAVKEHFAFCEYVLKGKELPVTSYYCSFTELERFLSTIQPEE